MNREVHRVLVVDDEQAVLDLAQRALRGREVLIESDARRVEERVTRECPDLVILDQWLNDGIRGHELANALKQRHPNQLIALWSAGLDALGMKYLLKNCSADHIDVKSGGFEQLIACVTGEATVKAPDWNAVPLLDDVRRNLVLRALAQCGGNRTEAARLLGVDRSTVIRWLG